MKRKLAALLAMVMVVSSLAGCGGSSNGNAGGTETGAADGEVYEATLMYWVSNDARDVQHVEDAFNALSVPQIGVKVKLQPITFGTYMQQIQMVLSSDDALDVFPMFSSNAGTYIDAGYVVDIAPYLETTGADILEIVGEDDVKCCSIGEFVWGVPTMHERCNPVSYVVRTDIFEEAGFTADDVKTMQDMTKVYEKVHELYPDMVLYNGINSNTQPCSQSTFDPLGGGNYGVLMNNGQDLTVVNWYETDEFRSLVDTMHEWNEKGYVSEDLAVSTDPGEALMKAGNTFSFSTYAKPNSKAEKDAMIGYDTTILQVTQPACFTSTTNALGYAVSANSENPEKAMELMNWIYKTKEANDLLNWGVEGEDYVVNEDGTIGFPEGVTAENVGYHQDFGWAMLNQYNSYVWEGNEPDVWDQYQEVRDNAIVSKAYGFTFDSTPVINEIAALTAVTEQYLTTIASGQVDPETSIKEMNDALYAAGLQKVMDEKQAQLDAWLAEQ